MVGVSGIITCMFSSTRHRTPTPLDYRVVLKLIASPSFIIFTLIILTIMIISTFISFAAADDERTAEILGARRGQTIGKANDEAGGATYPARRGQWFLFPSHQSLPASVALCASAAAAGICGGGALVLGSGLIKGIGYHGRSSVTNWRFYGLFLPTMMLSLLQVFFINRGLERFEALNLLPGANSCLVAVTVLMDSAMFHNEYDQSKFGGVMTLIGAGLTIAGMVFLSAGDSLRDIEQLQALEDELSRKGPKIELGGALSDVSDHDKADKEAEDYITRLERGDSRSPKRGRGSRGSREFTKGNSRRHKHYASLEQRPADDESSSGEGAVVVQQGGGGD
eukprot:GHVO01051589.1.p1 GENE.GHVO01051589.1~~GHVO01051589.1.p1  ORF type:complete len:338 (+),score=61.56 GHVO01051589.1:132-1145(+)